MNRGPANDGPGGQLRANAGDRWFRVQLVAGTVVPVITYIVLRSTLNDETQALAITELIPVAWVLAVGARRRRVDPIALAAAVVLGIALAISVAMGGSALPLKLRRAVVTGSIGLACLVSVGVRRPLLPVVLGFVSRAWPRSRRLTRALDGGLATRKWLVLTSIIGVTLLCDAVAQLTLALTVSTATFVGTSRLARTVLFTGGIALCGIYLRRSSSQSSVLEEPAADRREAVVVGQLEFD